jgi:hypothetical protein
MTIAKDLKAVQVQLFRGIKASTSPKQMRSIGIFVANMIRKRARAGYGVKVTGGRKRKFKKLASGKASNVTDTRQMLSSIGVRLARNRKVIVMPLGGRSKSDLANAEVASFVTKQGRPFMNLSKVELDLLHVKYDNILNKEMKKSTR